MRWLRTDAAEEAISALHAVAKSLNEVHGDLFQWKWALVGLHAALQGFMVLALSAGGALPVLREEDAKRWLEAYERREQLPDGLQLASFLELYKRIKGDDMLRYTHSQPFTPSGTQGASIKRLNSLRNQFVHFVPMGWSLEVTDLPQMVLDCLSAIRFLGWESSNVLWPSDEAEGRAYKALEAACSETVKLIDANRSS